jgi:hypothetical protein
MSLPGRQLSLLLLLVMGLGAGCARLRPPLVRPHQRAHLADRIMRVDGDRLSRSTDEHVLTTREGALGGGGAVQGGCGCN